MKNIFVTIFFLSIIIFEINTTYGQNPGENCVNAAPFCTDIVYDFPLLVGTTGEAGPNYGCLYTYPNPVWYYLKIANGGNMTIHIVGSNGGFGRDVDFICWGPFNSLSDVCTDSLYGACTWNGGSNPCPNNTTNPSFYPIHSAPNIIDCSYDAAPVENCRIPNAQHGEYYLLCITNFSRQTGMLTFSKVSGSGTATTDCSIVYNKVGFEYEHPCEGDYTSFSDTSTFSNPITSRLWDFGDGQTDTAMNPNHIYAAAGRYIVRLTVVADGSEYFTAKEVIVNKIIANITPSTPINICMGDSVNLDAAIITYPQTYESVNFLRTLNEPIPDTGFDSTYWNGYSIDPNLYNLYVADTVYVSGINPGWSINNISLNIEHPNDEDVMVYIKAPGGTSFAQLIKGCGGTGNNFMRTSFLPPPLATVNIRQGVEPFTGNYIPSGGPGIWSVLTGFVNPNGPWIFTVADCKHNQVDPGTLIDWSIEFNNPKQTAYTFKWLDPINDSIHMRQTVWPTDTTTYRLITMNEYGCNSYSEATVYIIPDPTILVNDTTICKGDTATLTVGGASTYTWMPGNYVGSEIKVAPEDTTVYSVTGTNTTGCTTTNYITVNVTTGPDIELPRDTTINPGESLAINVTGANTYLWMPGNIAGPTIVVSPEFPTDYYLYSTDERGCTSIDTITVNIDFSTNIFIPNTFSPNGDLQNDILYVRSFGIKEIDFTIYDRWGEKVFHSISKDYGWDGTYNGKPLDPGVYAYFLKAKTYDNKFIERKGNITLIK